MKIYKLSNHEKIINTNDIPNFIKNNELLNHYIKLNVKLMIVI